MGLCLETRELQAPRVHLEHTHRVRALIFHCFAQLCRSASSSHRRIRHHVSYQVPQPASSPLPVFLHPKIALLHAGLGTCWGAQGVVVRVAVLIANSVPAIRFSSFASKDVYGAVFGVNCEGYAGCISAICRMHEVWVD